MMIAITGGGTGGHLVIAKAIKEELNKRDIKPIFIGSSNGQDKAWFEHDNGFEKCYFLDTKGVVNKKGFGKISSFLNILKKISTVNSIFKTHEIKKVFSVGGYSAAPASFASVLFNKQLFIHEQNCYIGNLNRLLRPFAKEFFSSYLESSKVKDYPVSLNFFEHQRVRVDIKTIIFLGGSQGAKFINDFALSVALELTKKGIKIIHQCGKNEYERVKNEYEKLNIDVDLFDFSQNIVEKIAIADIAISRSGASSLWELSANGLPAIFIPYPFSANDHQYFNAKFLTDLNLALVYRQNEFSKELFFDVLEDINLKHISQNLINLIQKDGAKKIVDTVLSLN
ncbi:MAG: undecaprenyldiphospho-muramoylpentapeptide beta-N-acetylglucosaminyltransferase [Campylobacterales bacterium]|nr:undecaprenyldiphospho-muramoylpentapeptide beta-N-acetylglucosaminyltransferase [Campylobacterales bacterium]